MGLLSTLGLRSPDLFGHKVKFWRLHVQAGEQDAHVCVLGQAKAWDDPVIVSNTNQFVMPEDPHFKQTNLLHTEFQGVTAPVYEGKATWSADDADLEIPEYFHGRTIPEVDRDDDMMQEWATGEV